MKKTSNLPPWLRRKISDYDQLENTNKKLTSLGLNTICVHAKCPNLCECWSKGTATVLILGEICTRNCKFCSVSHGTPAPVDQQEPARIAKMAREMSLRYLVLTSVNRDDLPDRGALHFKHVVDRVRSEVPDIGIEILTPDFHGVQDSAIEVLSDSLPFVFGHNIETVPSLYKMVRQSGNYGRSLLLLKKAKQAWPSVETKSSLMLGLGETPEEVLQTMIDLRHVGVSRIAIGQYLKPSGSSVDVYKFITPEEFDKWGVKAKELGFTWVMSSPYTRSSYHAESERGAASNKPHLYKK